MKRVIESVVGEGRIEIFFEYKKLRNWLNLLIELVVMIVVFIIFLFLCYEYNIVTSPEKFKDCPNFFLLLPDALLAGLLFSLEQDVWAETLCSRQDGSVNQFRQEYKRGSCRHSHQENGLDAHTLRDLLLTDCICQ